MQLQNLGQIVIFPCSNFFDVVQTSPEVELIQHVCHCSDENAQMWNHCATHTSTIKMEDEMWTSLPYIEKSCPKHFQTFIIDRYCVPLCLFFRGLLRFQHAGQFHCSGLKLWMLLKEAQTTEEKSKEASYENQDTDVPGWLEHLSGFIVIHSRGSIILSGAVGKRSCRRCNPELNVVEKTALLSCCFLQSFCPTTLLGACSVPVASRTRFLSRLSATGKKSEPQEISIDFLHAILMLTKPRPASKSWLWRQGPILQRNGSITSKSIVYYCVCYVGLFESM